MTSICCVSSRVGRARMCLDGVSTSASGGQLESVSQSLRGWTARAGSFVAEKMALFERFSEDSRAASFIDR